RHDVLMILDGDVSVLPEELPKFYRVLVDGRGEFINGSRLVYDMEPGSMRFLNVLGNKLFSRLFKGVTGQHVKDTLSGTKALRRHLPALVALGVTFAVAATIVFSQPLGAPWWLYADADGTYVGSSLELAANDHARYMDHPGLPIQEALAIAFDAESVAAKVVHGSSHAEFMRYRLLQLDRTRVTLRSIAVFFYLAGALRA